MISVDTHTHTHANDVNFTKHLLETQLDGDTDLEQDMNTFGGSNPGYSNPAPAARWLRSGPDVTEASTVPLACLCPKGRDVDTVNRPLQQTVPPSELDPLTEACSQQKTHKSAQIKEKDREKQNSQQWAF